MKRYAVVIASPVIAVLGAVLISGAGAPAALQFGNGSPDLQMGGAPWSATAPWVGRGNGGDSVRTDAFAVLPLPRLAGTGVTDSGGFAELAGMYVMLSPMEHGLLALGPARAAREVATIGGSAGRQADCNSNGIEDANDIAGGTSDDCQPNSIPDECELGLPPTHNCCDTGHGAGCNDAVIEACVCAADEYCCSGEWDSDCAREVELFGCGSCAILNDCNRNGALDECDVLAGTSPDCNADETPDECEIAAGTSQDCNTNGIPDACDIAGGGSTDCDNNGVPDECEVSATARIRIAQESSSGAGDFDDHILGYLQPYLTTLTADGYFRYNLGNASSFNGPAPALVAERSHLFLVAASDGLSLFVVHDRPNNADGGSANTRYVLSGDPDGVFRSVEDDPPTSDSYTGSPGSSVFTANHAWATCCTDGQALTGLDHIWSMTMEFTSSISGMNSWYAYAPDAPPIVLALAQGRRVRLDVAFEPSPADCNGNGIPDACDLDSGYSLDCNGNQTPDECDVPPLGAGPDCNSDGVPDECQLEGNDCNTSGIPDDCELEGHDCNDNGVPDECEADCNTNGVADECDITGGTSPDCNASGTPDECDLAAGTSPDCNTTGIPDECELTGNDCNGNGTPDDCDVADGGSPDCNSNGVPDECELAGNDCNGNNTPDECDVADGGSPDCNSNGVPDECDLASGAALDCNANQTPDSCDITGGTSLDCQPDGVPDECQVGGSEYFTDFESGAGPEWSSSATDNSVPNPFTRFSGRFSNDNQTLTLEVVPGRQYKLVFDLMIIDSWDGNGPGGGNADWFNVYIDGTRVFHYTFSNFDLGNQTYPGTPTVGPAEYGWSGGWPESIYRNMILAFTASSSTVQIRFNGQDLQGVSDESWGVDNVRVTSGLAGDCNSNGVPDDCDVTGGTSFDCNSSGIPDECELDGNDCNSSGVPDECELEGNDCNSNGTPDDCDVAVLDCNSTGIPDDCELEGNDCNENGTPDECDVAELDCNSTGIPDDCELEGNDCNANGKPDECDLPGNDCNSNGVLDDCDMLWAVPGVDSLTLWLEAGIVSDVGDGQPVTTWPDRSGNGLDVTQVTTSAQPLYIANVLNGLPALRFDGDDYLARSAVLGSDLTSLDQATIFLVQKQAGTDVENTTLGWGTDTNRLLLHMSWQDRLHFQHGDGSSGAGGISVDQPPGWDDAFHLIECLRDGSTAEIRVDDELLIRGTLTDTPEVNEQHELRIANDAFGNMFTGDICEILVYGRALTGPERQRVNNYLKYRYGLGESPGGLTGDCNTNGVLDECDVAAGTSLDCNGNVVPDECETDCNTNRVPDDCDIAVGTSQDCQFNGVPDECDLPGNDCNSNAIPDDCDIAVGTSQDCQSNGVPDECDLPGNDCNSNAIPDDCDIAAATSADNNGNGLPDECEGPPVVLEQTPTGVTYAPFSAVEVRFNMEIDVATFTADDVVLVGPGGAITVDPPVEEADNRWRIGFAEQSAEGVYTLTIGPDVVSLAGHAMVEAYAGEFCLVIAAEVGGSVEPLRVTEMQPTVSHAAPLDRAQFTFSRTIDPASFTADDVLIIGPSGAIEVDSVTPLAGNLFEVAWAPQTEEGNYLLRVGPNVADVCGQLMDQDGDETAGEVPDDAFEGSIVLDTSPPQILAHNPAGTVHVSLSFLDVTFDEAIDGGTFDASDVSLDGPAGAITINSVSAQSGTVYRIAFATQNTNGDYTFTIGPDVLDQAGTAMVAAYQATVTLALPDLAVTAVTSPSQGGTDQEISVGWTVANQGDFDALGSWTDRVYLSDDAVAGGDVLLGTFTQSGPLAPTGTYVRSETVTLPTDTLGTYWIVVETNTNQAVAEAGTSENNSAVAAGSITVIDATPPETSISAGPANGTAINTNAVSFAWTGTDNDTATELLEYSYCLAPVATGCDPTGGPFSTDTTAEFGGLTEEDSPYVFRVVARDQADGVDATPAERTFSVDLTALAVTGHSPDGTVNDIVCAVAVTFSEPASGFGTDDVSLTGPSGVIPINQVVNVGAPNEFEFRFACQSDEGTYNFTVGPDIYDLAGNPMAEAYAGSFTIALPDLAPITLEIPTNGVAGEQISVRWVVENRGATPASGSWNDGIYLSDDAAWGDDTLLGEFTFNGTLNPGQSYDRTQNVTLPPLQAGSKWIIVVADVRDDVAELEEGAGNRLVSSEAIDVPLPPYPDLEVPEVTGPPSAWPEQQVTICWTVTNTGDGASGDVLWKDKVYFSTDHVVDLPFWNQFGVYDPGDPVLGEFENPSSLGPGESYQQCQSVTIPEDALGDYFFLVRADGLNQLQEYRTGDDAEANNDGGTVTACVVSPPPPADLRVTLVNAPMSGWSGQQVSVSWEVTNVGESPTPVGYWQDAVYLSVDETLDSSDRRIETFGHSGALAPGASYTQTQPCDLPRWFEGDYYLFVLTDSANHVDEQGWEGNNDGHDTTPLTINLTPPPDLEVTDLAVTVVRSIHMTVTVDWEVTNLGAWPTEATQWKDAIYLSEDDSFDTTADNVKVGGPYTHSGELDSFEFYQRSVTIELPSCIDGPYNLFLVTDVDDQVEEFFTEYEANNDDVFEPLFITTEEPDLEIANVDAPATGASGQSITVTWDVSNIGVGATEATSFVDRVYLSADQTLDVSEGSDDVVLGSFTHESVVGAGSSYSESRAVTLPVGISGSFFVFVRTAADGAVEECGATANNTDYDSAGIFVAFTEADLIVSNVTVPSIAMSGQPLDVVWTVVNAGNRATDATSWTDAVYLSADATLDENDDPRLGTFSHSGALDSAESYVNSNSVTLPAGVSGTQYVFVCTDYDDQVVEPGQESNNCIAAVPTEVVLTEPDLAVTAVSGPASGSSGDQITVEWTVENTGERATSQSSWTDAIYLSTDTTFDEQDDVRLGALAHSGALDVGESYAADKTVTLSAGGAGSYYLLVRTDDNEAVNEAGRETNNTGHDAGGIEVTCIESDLVVAQLSGPPLGDSGLPIEVSWTVSNAGTRTTSASQWVDVLYLSDDPDLNGGDIELGRFSHSGTLAPAATYSRTVEVTLPDGISGVYYLFAVTDDEDEVEECADEGNNTSTPPATVTVGATEVDLQVLSVNGPTDAYAGQEVTVGWSVINAGGSTTPNGTWRDSAYLSLDLFFDPATDPFLGFVAHDDPLGPGISYAENATFVIPASVDPGDYYVLVVADSTDEVYEHEAEDNNLGSAGDPTAVGEPLQADLLVTNIVVPLTATPGQQATFEWTVTNQGANAALGSWYDSIYLSSDETWDLSDALVAKVKHTGTVTAAGGTYTASKTALVPGVVPVPQYVIVRCDINDQIPEDEAGEANNIGISTDTVDIQIIELELGVPFDAQFAASGVGHYYLVTVPAEETLRVELDADSVLGANELYIRYGQIPDRGHYDDAHDSPFLPDQVVTIPTTQAGTYYILVYGDSVPSPPQSYTILADSVPFGISEVIPDTGSNTSTVTIEVVGARFQDGTAFSMSDVTDTEITPLVTYPQDQSRAFVTFDLNGAPAGAADVNAVNPDAAVTVAEGVFEVVSGGGPQLLARLIAPSRVRAGRPFPVRIEYANIGNADMPAPIFALTSPFPVPMDIDPDGTYEELGSMRFLGVNPDGPAGILPQGAFGVMSVYISVPDDGYWAHRFLQLGLVHRPAEEWLNWEAEEAYFRPADADPTEWAVAWDAIRQRVGDTWGAFEAEMAQAATRIWQTENRRERDLRELFLYEMELAEVSFPSRISGVILDAETGDPLPDASVRAWSDQDGDGYAEVISDVYSNEEGAFEHLVVAGTYELYAEDYLIDPPVTVEITADGDVTGVVLWAKPKPDDVGTPDPFPAAPDRSPQLAQDAAGTVHMVWDHGGEIWHSRFIGDQWEGGAQIGDLAAVEPQITRGPATAGPDSVTVLWREGSGNDAELGYAVGRPYATTSGFEWSDPVAVTSDAYAEQFPVLLMTGADELMIVWAKVDSLIEDDTDLYYSFGPMPELTWPAPGAKQRLLLFVPSQVQEPDDLGIRRPLEIRNTATNVSDFGLDYYDAMTMFDRDDEVCVTGKLGNKSFVRKLPIIGGPYGFEIGGEVCVAVAVCDPSASIGFSGELAFGKRRKFSLTGNGSAKWKTNVEKCVYEFDNAKISLGGSGTIRFPVDTIPAGRVLKVIGRWFWLEWDVGVQITGQVGGEAEWKKDFPGWPDRGYLTFELSGGPYGEISFTNACEAKVVGVLKATAEWEIPGSPRLTGVCIKLSAEAKAGWFVYKWKYEYPENCGGKSTLLGKPLSSRALVVDMASHTRAGEDVLDQITIDIDPLVGTGNQYPGSTVLGDISTDLTNDGPPSLALGAADEVLAVWTKDSGDPNAYMGNAVVVAEFDGAAWSPAVEVVDATDFNAAPQIVVGSAGVPMMVWSTASAAGISLANSVEEILAAMATTDLVYSQRIGGVWSAPASLASMSGGDDKVALAAGPAGQVLATWIHTDPVTEDVATYASLWDGSAWSAPARLSTGGIPLAVDCAYDAGATPLVVWSADADGDLETTTNDLNIYYATYTGTWTAPALLPKEETAKSAGRSGEARAGERIALPPPPDFCCCKTDADCVDDYSCTEDKCVKGKCENTKKDDRCDDLLCCNGIEVCNPDDGSADPTTGCVEGDPVCDSSPFPCVETSSDDCTCQCLINLDCDDGDPCTKDECVGPADDKHCQWSPQCDDGNPCTEDNCTAEDGPSGPTYSCENPSKCPDSTFCQWYTCDPSGSGTCESHTRDCGADTNCVHNFCVNFDSGGACRSSSNPSCDPGPEPITSSDPNEKIGPAGYGAEGWIPVGENQMFTILFENKPEALAPAQVVRITDQLSEHYDWRSFRISNIGWGDKVVQVSENRSFYQADVPYANSNGYLVRIDAGINVQTGEAEWTLTTIDPATGEVPTDADAGFLPPNDPETHSGEGFVIFTIRPEADAPTGTVVDNLATIVFDVNEPIDTNEVSNTIDSDPPTSTVLPLPEEVPASFEVQWTGDDPEGGSGLGSFDIYASEDGGPFMLWLSTPEYSATYTASYNGADVAFYSVARDNAGNMEEAPDVGQAETLSYDDTRATATCSSPVCEGDTIMLDARPSSAPGGPYTYSWVGPNGFTSDERAPSIPNATLAMAGPYDLTVINGVGIEMADSCGVEVQAIPVVEAGTTAPVCPGESVALSALVDNAAGARWTTDGDGAFDNDGDLETWYTPGDGDIAAGTVTLTLTADPIGPCTSAVGDTVAVTIYPCLTVNVEAGGLTAGEVHRPVSFTLTECGGGTETRTETVNFMPVSGAGRQTLTLRSVAANAEWLAVQEGHTLRTMVPIDLGPDRTDTVDVVLVSGDFHTDTQPQDNYVDITDFSILAARWETPIDPDESTGGDANGDGYHDAADFAVIQPNFYRSGDAVDDCPGRTSTEGPTTGAARRTSVPVAELQLTAAQIRRVDLDGNGVIDARDVRAFAKQHGLVLEAEFDATLRSMEAEIDPEGPAPTTEGR